MTDIIEQTAQTGPTAEPSKIRMTPAMRDGLDALQREYDAFVESSFNVGADRTPVGRS